MLAVKWLEADPKRDPTVVPLFDGSSFENREEQIKELREILGKSGPRTFLKEPYEFPAAALGWGAGKSVLFTRGLPADLCQTTLVDPIEKKPVSVYHCYVDLQRLVTNAAYLPGTHPHYRCWSYW
jgi:hypothetical protein